MKPIELGCQISLNSVTWGPQPGWTFLSQSIPWPSDIRLDWELVSSTIVTSILRLLWDSEAHFGAHVIGMVTILRTLRGSELSERMQLYLLCTTYTTRFCMLHWYFLAPLCLVFSHISTCVRPEVIFINVWERKTSPAPTTLQKKIPSHSFLQDLAILSASYKLPTSGPVLLNKPALFRTSSLLMSLVPTTASQLSLLGSIQCGCGLGIGPEIRNGYGER